MCEVTAAGVARAAVSLPTRANLAPFPWVGDWIKRYGPDCGLPLRGRPSDDKITSAAGCIGDAMEARIKELQAEH